MTEINKVYATLKKCKNNTSFRIILYVIFMTTFIIIYHSHENEEFENSSYLYRSYYNEATTLPPENSNKNLLI